MRTSWRYGSSPPARTAARTAAGPGLSNTAVHGSPSMHGQPKLGHGAQRVGSRMRFDLLAFASTRRRPPRARPCTRLEGHRGADSRSPVGDDPRRCARRRCRRAGCRSAPCPCPGRYAGRCRRRRSGHRSCARPAPATKSAAGRAMSRDAGSPQHVRAALPGVTLSDHGRRCSSWRDRPTTRRARRRDRIRRCRRCTPGDCWHQPVSSTSSARPVPRYVDALHASGPDAARRSPLRARRGTSSLVPSGSLE